MAMGQGTEYFYITVGKKNIKVFLPQRKTISIETIKETQGANQIDVVYKITENNKGSQYTKTLSLESNVPSLSLNQKKFTRFSWVFNLIPHQIKKDGQEDPFAVKKNETNGDQLPMETIQYSFKNGTMEALWDPNTRILQKVQIKKNNEIIYQDTLEKNKHFDFNRYPKEFSLEPNQKFLKAINKLADGIDDKIHVIVTRTFYDKTKAPNLQSYVNKAMKKPMDKPYILFLIPFRQTLEFPGIDSREHLYPLAILLERFNNVWFIKRIVVSTSCLNQFLFLNYQLHNKLTELLPNGPKKFQQKINYGLETNNLIIGNISQYTTGNHFHEIADFFQLRQSGSNCCYAAWAKDSLKLVDYVKSIVHNKPHGLDPYKLTIKDLMGFVKISLNSEAWDSKKFYSVMEQMIINHKTNVNFFGVQDNILGSIEINGPDDNGPIPGEETLELFKKNIPIIRKQYFIFFIRYGKTIHVYCVHRNKENLLDNNRYYVEIKRAFNDYYPQYEVAPLVYVAHKNFSSTMVDVPCRTIYHLLQMAVAIPSVYDKLKDLAAIDVEVPKETQGFYTFLVCDTKKSILPDSIGDVYMFMLFMFSDYYDQGTLEANEKAAMEKQYGNVWNVLTNE
jgi:hypothetical protein